MLVHVCICVTHVCLVPVEAKKMVSNPLELELCMILSCLVGSRNWVVCKSS